MYPEISVRSSGYVSRRSLECRFGYSAGYAVGNRSELSILA